MDAGKLDRRLEILGFSEAKDTIGQVHKAFVTVTTVYAERLDLRTADAARAGQRDVYAIARFKIRYRTGLNTGMRVQCDDITYDIVAIDQPPPRRSCLVLTVEEVA